MILGDVHSYFVTDDSTKIIAPIFKGEAVEAMDYLTLEDGGDILYTKTSNELPTTPSNLQKCQPRSVCVWRLNGKVVGPSVTQLCLSIRWYVLD